jgi:hypothetical protein
MAREQMVIEQVANGFLVLPLSELGRPNGAKINVFSDLHRVGAFLSEHFESKEEAVDEEI